MTALPDPDFFALSATRAWAEEGRKVYRDVLARQQGGRCPGCTLRRLLGPLLNRLGRALAAGGATVQQEFKDYVDRRIGYRPSQVVLFYAGAEGRVTTLKF